ncbi:MAG: hypothetical protein ABGX07_08340 [Pirellulaceae bacterium]|jgi:hypothetical protein|nr:hypothetical protein [Planctomycetaceae bacterium]HIM28170.1 hypothetical protein [Planctomycetota bacterium]
MNPITRREFAQTTIGSLLTYSLLETIVQTDVLGDEVAPIADQWLRELQTLGQDIKGTKISQVQWQKSVEDLFKKIDLADITKAINYEQLVKTTKFKDRGEHSTRPKLPQVEGLPTRLIFGTQVFALKKNRSVVPHGHNNMATAFVILDGKFHGRHYDRLEDDKQSMIIKPTIDRQFGRSDCSTVSDTKDNVHWFKATSQTGFIFNIHVLSVKPGRTGRVYVDPDGEKLSGGRIRARIIKSDEAYKKYG